MPAPVAKGIIITVSVLVAAGIAIYESPQFQQWLGNSRRKIALALHSLGDEIHPRDANSLLREDISMTEDVSPAAAERRRLAREEILRRGAEARLRKRQNRSLGTFDALVDENGNLRKDDAVDNIAAGSSTATELHHSTSGMNDDYLLRKMAVDTQETPAQQLDDLLSVRGEDRLHIRIPAESVSHDRPESLVELTPTSENAEIGFGEPINSQPVRGSESGFFSVGSRQSSLSSHTDAGSPKYYYAHPGGQSIIPNVSHVRPSLYGQAFQTPHGSSAASTAGSFSHIDDASTDLFSDEKISEMGLVDDGIPTPASWSEVGSVISGDDAGHQ